MVELAETTNVLQAQRALRAAGFETSADGVFGQQTQTAVRGFQRAHGISADGVVGPLTAALLGLAPSIQATSSVRQPCHHLTTSEQGAAFIFAEEAGSCGGTVCWPGGASGVTIGPGYDMKNRAASHIEADMLSIGLDAQDARTMGSAASEAGGGAQAWVDRHRGWPRLTGQQQRGLLRLVLPGYEALVHRLFQTDLRQHEFDALVSIVYNPERSVISLARAVANRAYAEAAADILSRVGNRPDVERGLKARREREVALFLHADYGNVFKGGMVGGSTEGERALT